jgi:hypothetical protein
MKNFTTKTKIKNANYRGAHQDFAKIDHLGGSNIE